MQDDAITYRGTVYPWQCDHMDRTLRRSMPFPEHIARAARIQLSARPIDVVIE